ncbi:DUF3299 domain-containing protein [Variovorax sp. GB1P17]|uniref:DUF3299 domain-containing protein n=1 Tax=Variovorax sp. GB1P17 TaxID=3443740 RepID=UPI003F452817
MASHPSPLLHKRRRLLPGVAVVGTAFVLRRTWAADDREISWDDLVPKDWDPMKSFRDLQHLGALPDSDARVQKLYDRMRKVWDEAPTVPSLAGQAVKIPGFLVPLEAGKDGIREFLLVPYFGACIHTPPPPANQIIHVRSASPLKGLRTMDAVWVSGKLGLERSNSDLGVTGYSLSARHVTKYTQPK